MYGIMCTIALAPIVNEVDLRVYQLKWEEELREILDNLVKHSFESDE